MKVKREKYNSAFDLLPAQRRKLPLISQCFIRVQIHIFENDGVKAYMNSDFYN